jgi:hypothetical protein
LLVARFRLELVLLTGQCLLLVLQSLTTALILLQRHHLVQIGLGQALQLARHTRLAVLQLRAARLQVLWEPLPAVRLLKGLCQALRMREDLAQILPHQGVELVRGGEACGALFRPARVYRRHLAIAHVIAVRGVPVGTPSGTGLTAVPATDQGAQQVGVHGIVPRRGLLILGELGLDLFKLFLTDHGGDRRHADPARGRHLDLGGHPLRDRPQRGEPPTTRAPGGSARIDVPSIRGILQEASYGIAVPDGLTGSRGNPLGHEPLREAIQTAARGQIAGKDLLDQRALGGFDPDAGWIARTLQTQAIAVRRDRPGEQDACMELMQSPPAHPLGNENAFVFRHCAPNLQEQLVVRILTHRPVQEFHLTASARKLFQEHHLVDVVPGEPIGSGEQHQVTPSRGDSIAQGIESWSTQGSATEALVTKE